MRHWPPRPKPSLGAAEVFFKATLVPAVLLAIGACKSEAEPRWLLRALPGKFPEGYDSLADVVNARTGTRR